MHTPADPATSATHCLLLSLAYDGHPFCGWQIQPGSDTVQDVLQSALKRLYKQDIIVAGSSRTDARVHAIDYRASFLPPAKPEIQPEQVATALNSMLPPTIRVHAVETRPADYFVRHHVTAKAYVYLIHSGSLRSPFLAHYCWPVSGALDAAAMNAAAAVLTGTHDFSGFAVSRRDRKEPPSPTCTVDRLLVEARPPFLQITVVGNRFLYRMVRRLTGFLVEVGRGRLDPAAAPDILKVGPQGDQQFATAPPEGLYLAATFFDTDTMAAFGQSALPFMAFLND